MKGIGEIFRDDFRKRLVVNRGLETRVVECLLGARSLAAFVIYTRSRGVAKIEDQTDLLATRRAFKRRAPMITPLSIHFAFSTNFKMQIPE